MRYIKININKVNILMITVGLGLIIISLVLGFLESFNGGRGGLLLSIGVGILAIGIAFTPKMWEWIAYIADSVSLFISGLK
ncbi:MAG: hypothetical protein ACRC68_04435 [Clostridium sp.]